MKKIIPIVVVVVFVLGIGYFVKFKNSDAPAPILTIDDQALVEKYIRDNIKTLAPEQPVLGGSWYVVGVSVDSMVKSGAVVYEDGHIQGTAIFKYKLNGNDVVVENINAISVNDKYIHPIKWPPVVVIVDKPFVCEDGSNEYCVVVKAEGAAGSTYTEYTYTKPYGNKTASINFTVQSVQCLNYDEPNTSECTDKQKVYNLEPFVDILFGEYF